MSNGPAPSRLVLLSQLRTLEPGTKVRFLGCVHEYEIKTGRITLRTRYPNGTTESPTALVDISEILENLPNDVVQKGNWINVIGTVLKPERRSAEWRKIDDQSRSRESAKPAVGINATMIWSAGVIKLEQYEAAVRAYQQPLIDK